MLEVIDKSNMDGSMNNDKKFENLSLKYKEELQRKNKIRELILSNDYIEWLEKFTIKNPMFSDSFGYNHELEEKDRENISNIKLFYQGLEEYALRHNVSPEYLERGQGYIIKHHDNFYLIGYINYFGITYGCEKVDNKRKLAVTDFKDIQNSKKQDDINFVNEQLTLLSNLIFALSERDGISLEKLSNTTEKTFQKILERRSK